MSYESITLALGPVLYLRLDEEGSDTNGSIWPDISGNGLDAVQQYTGAIAQARGHNSPIETDPASREFRGWGNSGSGSQLVGLSHLVVANDSLLQLTGDFTVQDWVRPEGGAPAVTSAIYIMAGKVDFDGNDYGIGMTGANSELVAFCRDSSGTGWSVGSGISALLPDFYGTSYFICAVRLGNSLAVYVNGVLKGQVTITSGLPTKTSTDPFMVEGGTAGYLQNRHDEVAVFDYAVSGDDILAQYLSAINVIDVRGVCNIRTSAQITGTDDPDPVAYSFRHNWDQPVVERLHWRTSLFKPEDGSTEFARQRSSLRRQVEYQHLLYSEKLRRQYEARSFAGRTTINQFEPDKVRVETLLAGATAATFDTRYYDFEVGHRVLIYQDDDTYEHSTLTVVTDGGIEWEDALSRDYINPWVKPARVARLPLEQQMDAETDTIGVASTIYEYQPEDEPLSPRRIIPFTPTLTYRDKEVFDLREWQGHDYSEIPAIQYVADRSELDFATGVVTTKQYRWGAETVTPYNMNLQGRALIAKYLGWLYERAGMYSPFWMPTFRQDLQPLSRNLLELTISGHEYTNLYAPADNRQDLAFVYFDGTYAMRRIESSTTDGGNDVLTLDSTVPTFTNLRWLCFLRRVVLASDDLELAWETDNVVRVAFAVRDAPLDFTLGSPSMSPSPSPSISLSPSPSHSASGSASPSHSVSPSV